MNFFLDENIPRTIRSVLQNKGFEVEDVHSANLRGADDAAIAVYAKKNKAILVTRDLELGNLQLYPKGSNYGLLVLRLPHEFTAKQIADAVELFLEKCEANTLINAITILELSRYRIRRLSNGN